MNYYKKKLDFFKLCLFLFFTCLSFAQTQTTIQNYLNIEQVRLFKADSIEADITNYVQTNLPMYNLSAQTVSDVTNNLLNEHDATDNPIVGADLQTVLQQVKQNDLRSSYFNTHPNVSSFFNATVVPQELRINCINGGFETGNTANYTFRTTVVNPTSHLTNGCSTSNFNAFAPSPLFNLYQNSATIVTPANEPFLAGLNININQVRTGNFALKINPNPNSVPTLQIGNSTSVSRDFMINGNTINFSFLHFGYVVNGHNQPTFRYRLYRIDVLGNIAGILREVCIPLTVNDCRYTRVSDNRLGVNTLSYTPNWVCQEINTGNLVGQNVRLEFTVSDCEYRGHFSTAYIDDLCGVDYPPTWGSIQLQNINLNCPRINFDVCGTFQLPASSSINSLVLNILNPSGAIVGTVLNPVITSVSNFCFTVNPSIFGANPNGNYTFQVIANLNGACTTPLMDISGNVTFSTLATPTFTQVANICSGATLSALPTTSTNGINGTWSPALNNTVTTTYTFTPTVGLCANTTTMTITVTPKVTPTFTQVATICSGTTLSALPTTSTNGITGTWSPALNNTATTTYTFTPTAGLCANTKTMTIAVNPKVTPTFTQVATICSGATLSALPTTSTNGITGTWSPALNNTASTTYTFTPTAGLCANTTTMTIAVTPKVTPTFTQVATICSGATLSALPTTSTNGITGTWSPALNNTATTTYTFTPAAGLCASTKTMTITVTPKVTPTFTQVAPICKGATLLALPTTSTNGITGTWLPALNNTATTTYTFTPTTGLCASKVTMIIVVNPVVIPTFTQVPPYCIGSAMNALPTTSNNGITGTWSPTLNNMATTVYTFIPNNGQCAQVATMTIMINSLNVLTANNDTYTVTFSGSNQAVASVMGNDFFNTSQASPSTPNLIVVQTGTSPTFTAGGITLNADGTLNVLANTPIGTYTFTYQLTYPCTANSNTGTITVTINTGGGSVQAPPKYGFMPVCYSRPSYDTSESILENVTVNGVPANSSNVTIAPSGLMPAGLVLNADGTLTIPANLSPDIYDFYATVCAVGGSCQTIKCYIEIQKPFEAGNDGYTFDLIGNIPSNTPTPNVITNDFKRVCSYGAIGGIAPLTMADVNITGFGGNGSLSFLLNTQTGVLTYNGAAVGDYVLNYTICDKIYGTPCSIGYIFVRVITSFNSKMSNITTNGRELDITQMTVSPNPSENEFNLHFNTLVKNVTLEVCNLSGQKVHSEVINDKSDYQLLLSNLPVGTYLLKVSTENQSITKLLVKK